AATDGSLAFAVGDVNAGKDPSIGTSAYTNSFNGATATTLYNYDDSLNILTSQIPPNSGTLNTIGSTGITANLTDPSTDMDIFYNPFNGVNTAYLTANTGMSASDMLYTLNLATGSATAMGRIGNGIAVTDIAVTIQPVETACDTKTSGCIKYEVLSISQSASGDKTYRIRVTNTCAEKLFYTAFELPKSVVAETPGNSYSSPAGQTYEVRNPNFSPFYSIRFKPQGANGISGGQMDIFEYSLPAYASPRYIHAISRVGNSTYQEVYLNVFSCAVNSQDNSGANRDAAVEDAIQQTEARIFPNPATDRVTADLSGWEAPQVQVRLFNTQGQMALDFTAANAGQLSFPLPKQLPEGLYLLELSSEGGKKSVQKLRIQR
ncbi:MAG: DUF4394 domain-containing protein, partial [Saprospiraceae bacterium]|nr:DUF4394 domain-containing protein [Saprospiraceae bacterium]